MSNFSSEEPCICCGKTGEYFVCYHHIYTRKSRPDLSQEKWNMIPVCKKHHLDFHNFGTNKMASSYKSVLSWLSENGWEYSPFKNRFVNKKGLKE